MKNNLREQICRDQYVLGCSWHRCWLKSSTSVRPIYFDIQKCPRSWHGFLDHTKVRIHAGKSKEKKERKDCIRAISYFEFVAWANLMPSIPRYTYNLYVHHRIRVATLWRHSRRIRPRFFSEGTTTFQSGSWRKKRASIYSYNIQESKNRRIEWIKSI